MSTEKREWQIKARLTYYTTTTVEAVDEAEAISKFKSIDWIDDGMNGAELVDYERESMPKKVGQ